MTHLDLIHQLERDIRNQVVIDRFKRLNWKGKLAVHFNRNAFYYMVFLSVGIWAFFFWGASRVLADEPHIQCPDPGVKCKVLFLTEQEEQMLMTRNGILDTAAQGRSLDLGQFSVYLKTRIGSAPQGEVKPVEQPKSAEAPKGQVNPAEQKPVDSK